MYTKKKNYSASIQSLKGIAAIVVFLSHALGMCICEEVSQIRATFLNIFFDGQCAVVIFFCLTGYFSYREEKINAKLYFQNVAKKAVRIYPSYILVTVVAWTMANSNLEYERSLFTDWCNSFWQEQLSLVQLFKAVVLILPFDTDVLNPPTWYIQVDMRMAFVLPLLTCLLASMKRFKISGIFLLSVVFAILQLPMGLMFLPYYGGGHFLRLLCMNNIETVSSMFKGTYRWFILIMGLSLLDCYNIMAIPESQAPGILRMIQVVGSVLIVGFFAFNSVSWINRIFHFLGDISYEFYLIHFVLLLSLRALEMPFALYIIIVFLLTLTLAFLMEKYISSPVRKCYKRLNDCSQK